MILLTGEKTSQRIDDFLVEKKENLVLTAQRFSFNDSIVLKCDESSSAFEKTYRPMGNQIFRRININHIFPLLIFNSNKFTQKLTFESIEQRNERNQQVFLPAKIFIDFRNDFFFIVQTSKQRRREKFTDRLRSSLNRTKLLRHVFLVCFSFSHFRIN